MKSKALPLLVAVSGLGILGCTAIPQAGLIYSSTVIAGVGMKVSTTDATSPVDISIGFKTHDFAYVPVAVVEAKDLNKGEIVKVWGSHGQNTADSNDCAAALKQYPAVLGTTATKEDKDKVNAACDNKRDAMSVYGQFNRYHVSRHNPLLTFTYTSGYINGENLVSYSGSKEIGVNR